MRITHVITGLNEGGAEATLYRLIRNDAKDIHHVISLTSGGKYKDLLSENGIKVTCLELKRRRLSPRTLFQLRTMLEDSSPDVVQTWMYHADFLGGIASKLNGVPVVWSIRNTSLERKNVSLSTIAVAQLCAFLSWSIPRAIIACASAAARAHTKIGYCSKKITTIYNGYDDSILYPDEEKREALRKVLNIPSDVFLIGMVARFDPAKDHENLLTALEVLMEKGVDYRALLIGTNVELTNSFFSKRLLGRAIESRVTLLGSRSDIPSIMNAIDVHVLSSSSEAFPNVIAEAMACGTPCVSTNVGDANIIVGATGWVVDARNPNSLAEAILAARRSWQNREEWLTRADNCKTRIAENFGIRRMVDEFRGVWQAQVTPPNEPTAATEV